MVIASAKMLVEQRDGTTYMYVLLCIATWKEGEYKSTGDSEKSHLTLLLREKVDFGLCDESRRKCSGIIKNVSRREFLQGHRM